MKIYEIYYANLDGIGSEQTGLRPCIIVSNNLNNLHSPTVTVIPVTSRCKNHIPTHCKIKGLPKSSIAMAEQIRTIDKTRIVTYITTLKPKEIDELKQCIKIQLTL